MVILVAYYRVSTQAQGVSGLGIEGQQAAVAGYCKSVGAKLQASYTEVESGRSSERPELAKAIAHARRSGGTLVVAKLDRLSRNVAFLSALMESKIPFLACDTPHATPLTIHILAAVAEAEAISISTRTAAAMLALKARGVLLGSARPGHWEGKEEARRRGAAEGNRRSVLSIRRATRAAFIDLVPQVLALRKEGLSMSKIAARLNEAGHTSRAGNPWNERQVMTLLQRAKVWMTETATAAETTGGAA